MSDSVPFPRELAEKSIVTSVIFTLLTCGIYGLVWQSHRFHVLNGWLGRRQFSFWSWFLFGLLTLGIYWIYTEYLVARSMNEIQRRYGFDVETNYPLLFVIVSIAGLGIVASCIQQNEINTWYRNLPFTQTSV